MAVVDGELLVMVVQEGAFLVLGYRYDANISAKPQYELNVCTLNENPTLTLVAKRFRERYPEYRVNIVQLLSEDTGMTANDAIQALNTQLLAGKGPDVLLLDGMPMDDYIDKSMLLDLSPAVDSLSDELLTNLFEPLRRDGVLFAAPASCLLPVAFSKGDGLAKADTLDALAGLIEQSPAETPIAWRTRQGYFSMFLPASMPAWFDARGQMDEAKLIQYLEFVGAIFRRCGMNAKKAEAYQEMVSKSHDGTAVMNGEVTFPYDLYRLEDGRSVYHVQTIGSFLANMIELKTLDVEVKGTLSWMPGQAGHVYLPQSLLGVNARSGQAQAALDFVRLALSQTVQDVDVHAGLPVNAVSLATHVDEEPGASTWIQSDAVDFETGEPMMMIGTWPERFQREQVSAMLKEASVPYIPDQSLLSIMKTELAPFFNGEQDAQTAAAQVAAKVRAYLAE